MSHEYQDRWITCTGEELRIRAYYFPWGTKRIPYARVRAVRRAALGTFSGRGRIWGTANPRYWAGLDPGRPGKATALILDLGGLVQPVITPDDPDAVEATIRKHARLEASAEAGRRGPIA